MPVITDAVGLFRFEVYFGWVMRFSAEEKTVRPLAAWTVGPDFMASLETTEGVHRRNVDHRRCMLLVVAPEVPLLEVVR